MIELTIPGWAIYVFGIMGTLIVPWMVYITVKTFENKAAIAVNTANDEKVSEELDKIYNKISETKTDLQKAFDKLDSKIDTFIASEMSFLKQILTKP